LSILTLPGQRSGDDDCDSARPEAAYFDFKATTEGTLRSRAHAGVPLQCDSTMIPGQCAAVLRRARI